MTDTRIIADLTRILSHVKVSLSDILNEYIDEIYASRGMNSSVKEDIRNTRLELIPPYHSNSCRALAEFILAH